MATRYEADAYCGCHGNLVTIAMRCVADAYCLIEPQYQILKTKELQSKMYLNQTQTQLTHLTHKSGQLIVPMPGGVETTPLLFSKPFTCY